MAATVTKLSGPVCIPGGTGVRYDFSILMDSSYPAGGEAIDLTDYLSYINSATVNSVDAVADALYKFDVVIPANGTAITSTNVVVHAAWTGTGDGAVFDQVTATTDLSSVGELTITVVGKAAVDTTW